MGVSQQKIDKDNMIRIFDKLNNTDFAGWIFRWDLYPNDNDKHGYEPSYNFDNIFNKLDITESDKIVDIGCGKGYAMYLLSKYKFSKIDGIELTKKLADCAKSNFDTLFGKDLRFTIYNCNVLDWTNFDNYNYYYLCNPFGVEITRFVANEIKKSAINKKEKKIVVYQMGEFTEEFLNIGFKKIFEDEKNVALEFSNN